MKSHDFTIPVQGAELAATYTYPSTSGPFTTLLLIPGSGPIDRDENNPRIKLNIFRDMARYFANLGIATVRYDKRGINDSTGDYYSAGVFDNMDDATAVLLYCQQNPDIKNKAMFVVGHSEGAMIAANLATKDLGLGGAILVAGHAQTGRSLLEWQAKAIQKTIPLWLSVCLRLVFTSVTKAQRRAISKVDSSTKDVIRVGWFKKLNAKWIREFLQHNPLDDIRNSQIPLMAITGQKDLQVPATDLQLMQEAAGRRIEVHSIPDLTHILRRDLQVPSVTHYQKLTQQPTDETTLILMYNWIGQHEKLADRLAQ